MANALFTNYGTIAGTPGTTGPTSGDAVNWEDDNIKCVLVDHGVDTPVPGTDQFLSDIAAGVEETSANLTTTTFVAAVADADDVSFPGATGNPCESVVIYKDTGNPATSPLIVYIDTANGLPVTLTGGTVNVIWSDGPDKIYRLVA